MLDLAEILGVNWQQRGQDTSTDPMFDDGHLLAPSPVDVVEIEGGHNNDMSSNSNSKHKGQKSKFNEGKEEDDNIELLHDETSQAMHCHFGWRIHWAMEKAVCTAY